MPTATLDDAIARHRQREDSIEEIVDEIVALRGHIAELERRIVNVVRMGRVTAVNGNAGTVDVAIATQDGEDVVVSDLRWGMRCGKQQEWDPPSVGEQVVIVSPGGDMSLLTWVQKGGFTQSLPKKDSRLGVYRRSLDDKNFFEQTPDAFKVKAPDIQFNPSGSSETPSEVPPPSADESVPMS